VAVTAVPVFFRGNGFSIRQTAGRIEVLTGGTVRWTIDSAYFGPKARTQVERHRDGFVMRLTHAVFPGTELAADFDCVLTRPAGVWTMRLTNALGMDLAAAWMDWLEHRVPATGAGISRSMRLFRNMAIGMNASEAVQFTPDWVFSAGRCLVMLEDLPKRLASERVQWRVNGTAHLGATVLDSPATLFHFARGHNEWQMPLRREHPNGWRLDHDHGLELFDELSVEAGESAGEPVQTALLSASSAGETTLRFFPGEYLRTEEDEPFHVRLGRPRLVFSLGEPAARSVLLADVTKEETWAHTETVSLGFGAQQSSGGLELHSVDEESTLVSAPSVTAVHVPAADTSIRITFKDGKAPSFQWSHFVQPIERALGAFGTPPWEHALAFDLSCGDVLSVVRPADMLKLEFEFQDMVLHAGFSPRIEIAKSGNQTIPSSTPKAGDNDVAPDTKLPCPALHCKPGGAPRVTVTFPPQHIDEQAFYHNDDLAWQKVTEPGIGTTEINRLLGKPETNVPTAEDKKAAENKADPDTPLAKGTKDTVDKLKAQPAGESHLVFDLTGTKPIPFRLEDLLNWQNWTLVVDPVARTSAVPVMPNHAVDPSKNPPLPDHAPAKNEATVIELPYRLVLSPSEKAQWAHSSTPVSYGNNVELWHTRLAVAKEGTAPDEANQIDRTVRAIYSPDRLADRKLQDHQNSGPRFALDARDRAELVYLTSDFQNRGNPATSYTPLSVNVDHLMLTSQGGYLKSIGNWNPPLLNPSNILTVEQWKHTATVGRNQYVRVVYKGYLAPFAHRVSLVKVTERMIVQADGATSPGKNWFALLHQRMYIVVHQPRRDFPLFGQPNGGRDFPFRRIDLLTTVTPDLDDPTAKNRANWVGHPDQGQSLFWPFVNGQPFLFRFRFWDVEGNVSEASMPVVFGDAQQAQTHDGVGKLRDLYNGGQNGLNKDNTTARKDPWTSIAFGDQTLAFAPSSQPGDTRYDAATMFWQIVDQSTGVVDPKTGTATHDLSFYKRDIPLFAPRLANAQVSSGAIKHIMGNDGSTWVKYFDTYVEKGFDPQKNPGEVLLQVDNDTLPALQFGAHSKTDQSGGFSSPDTAAVGFSRKSGPVGGTTTSSLQTWSSGKFDPPDFFGAFNSAKILGAVKLSDIIAPLLGGINSNLEKAPQMIQQQLFNVEQKLLDFEKQAVANIHSFQNALPTNGGTNPLTRRLAPQAQAVYGNLAALQQVQGDSPNLLTEVAAAPYHARLIRSLIDYGEALDAAVSDPASLAAGIVDDAMAAIQPAVEAAEQEVENAIESLVMQLIADVSGPLQMAIDKFFLPLNRILATAILPDPLRMLDDTLRSATVAAHDVLPELMGLAAMLPVAQRLQGSVQQIATKGGKDKKLGLADIPFVVQQTVSISQDLLQLLQAAGPLGCAAKLSDADWKRLQNALLEIQDKLLKLWQGVQDAASLAKQLQAVEQACMALADQMKSDDSKQLSTDGTHLMQNLRQFQRSAAMIDSCRASYQSLVAHGKQTNAAKVRYVQRLQQLQRQVIDNIRALQGVATDLLDATAKADDQAVAAASQLLVDLYFGSDMLVQQFTCVKGLFAQTVDDLLRDSQGGITLTTFLPVVSVQLAALSDKAKHDQANATRLVDSLGKKKVDVSAAHLDMLTALATNTNVAAKKTALLQAWAPAIVQANSFIDSASSVYDQVVQYVNCAELVVSWWIYTGYPELQALASRKNLESLALAFADSECQIPLPGQSASICGTAASTLNSILNSSKKLVHGLEQAPLPVPSLFAGVTTPLNQINPLAPAARPAEVLQQSHLLLSAYTQCVTEVRNRATSALGNAKTLLQARNLIPFLLANLPVPHTLSLTYNWHPQIKSFEPVFLLAPGADFRVSASSQVDLTGNKPPSYNISATLTNFAINLIGSPSFVIVRVNSLTFTAMNGDKPNIRLKIKTVEFGQALSFVQQLASALNPQTGPFMEFVGAGIRAGFRFHVPNIQVGGFLLMQLAIEVAVGLSFDGSPVRCQFSLSDQQNPFLLSAGIYGGGGFLQLQLGLDGVQVLEGALEFGLVAGITIGPLSGWGYVVAGIYMQISKNSSVVAGFVHAHGHMDIFRIISMDVDLFVTVKYAADGNVSGSAVFTVSVHILFFSADYTLEATYGFQGSGKGDNQEQSALSAGENVLVARGEDEQLDPWMSDEAWTEYHEAFVA
jgi:hypothetical protein